MAHYDWRMKMSVDVCGWQTERERMSYTNVACINYSVLWEISELLCRLSVRTQLSALNIWSKQICGWSFGVHLNACIRSFRWCIRPFRNIYIPWKANEIQYFCVEIFSFMHISKSYISFRLRETIEVTVASAAQECVHVIFFCHIHTKYFWPNFAHDSCSRIFHAQQMCQNIITMHSLILIHIHSSVAATFSVCTWFSRCRYVLPFGYYIIIG